MDALAAAAIIVSMFAFIGWLAYLTSKVPK